MVDWMRPQLKTNVKEVVADADAQRAAGPLEAF